MEEENEVVSTNVAEISSEELLSYIRNNDVPGLTQVFETVPNIDIAEAADEFDPKDLIFIFRNIESDYTADFFDCLSQETKENLIKAMTDKDLVAVINAQSADDMADTVGDMPANLASRVLKAADKDMRKDINALLKFKDGTAGALMTTEFIEMVSSTTVGKAIEEIREKGKDAETVYTIFVRDRFRNFVGTAGLDDLIFAKASETLEEIMNKDIVSCTTATDQEEVAQMFRRYDLTAMAVLNDDQRLVGVITVDDAVDVMAEEANEDLARLTLMEPSEKPYMQMSAWENARKCIPWLIALLVLGTFTTLVLNRLESQPIFHALLILTSFIPALMDTGGNAGGQTTGLMIRGLAVDEFGPRDIGIILLKELKSALIVAAAVGSFAFLWVTIEQYTGIVSMGDLSGTGDPTNPLNFVGKTIWDGSAWYLEFATHALRFSGLVALTMFAAILAAKMIGTLLPMGAAAIKKDPALLSQPMLTTIMDATILVIYYGVACAFFGLYA